MNPNLLAILIAFAFIFAALGIAEALRKALKLPPEFTRKVVHVTVGMWAWGTAWFFTDKWFAIVPPAVFVLLNYLSYRKGTFAAMESGDKQNLGTVWFPLAFIGVILVLFDVNKWLMATALMPLTWGDAFAAVLGRRFGTHRYTVGGGTRSFEGSAAMFVFSALSVALGLMIALPGCGTLLPIAIAVAAAATLAEAISVRGLDNLFVPAASVIVLLLMRPLC
jgi:phytol kinase